MIYKISFFIAICLEIAISYNCTEKPDIPDELVLCCTNEFASISMLKDPCFANLNEGIPDEIECVIQCLYKTHNIMINDTINIENVKQYLKTIGEKAMQDTYTAAFETCDKFGKQTLIEKFGHVGGESKCKGYFFIFDTCVALNALARCPKNMWHPSAYCNEQFDFLHNCVFK